MPGANGVALDERGDLWVSDGGTAQGRVWRIGRDRTPVEMFRVQPLANDAQPGGVGRDMRGLPPGTITITETGRQASNTLGSQHIVANGLAFGARRDAVRRRHRARRDLARVPRPPRPRARRGPAATRRSPPNTLCLDNVLVQHPYLDGADGIVLDDDDNIYVAANERNAIAVVTRKGRAVEWYRNAAGARPPAQRGPARVPDQPGARRPQAVHDQLRRRAARQLPGNAAGEGPKINCV